MAEQPLRLGEIMTPHDLVLGMNKLLPPDSSMKRKMAFLHLQPRKGALYIVEKPLITYAFIKKKDERKVSSSNHHISAYLRL